MSAIVWGERGTGKTAIVCNILRQRAAQQWTDVIVWAERPDEYAHLVELFPKVTMVSTVAQVYQYWLGQKCVTTIPELTRCLADRRLLIVCDHGGSLVDIIILCEIMAQGAQFKTDSVLALQFCYSSTDLVSLLHCDCDHYFLTPLPGMVKHDDFTSVMRRGGHGKVTTVTTVRAKKYRRRASPSDWSNFFLVMCHAPLWSKLPRDMKRLLSSYFEVTVKF